MSPSAEAAPGRRAFLAGALAFAAAPALAQAGAPVRAIRLDLGPLAARGQGGLAAYVQPVLEQALHAAFADRLAHGGRGGATLVATVSAIRLAMFAGGAGHRALDGDGGSDYLEGQGALLGAGGAILAQTPVLLAMPATSSGAWYLPDIDQRRLASLARNYAGWLRARL